MDHYATILTKVVLQCVSNKSIIAYQFSNIPFPLANIPKNIMRDDIFAGIVIICGTIVRLWVVCFEGKNYVGLTETNFIGTWHSSF